MSIQAVEITVPTTVGETGTLASVAGLASVGRSVMLRGAPGDSCEIRIGGENDANSLALLTTATIASGKDSIVVSSNFASTHMAVKRLVGTGAMSCFACGDPSAA